MALRTTKFLGIPEGTSTSIAALQAGVERSLGPLAWRVSGGGGPPLPTNATFSIVVESAAVPVAPHAQWFGVANLQGFAPAAPPAGIEAHDPQAHDITWIWSFGEVGSVPSASANLPDAWRDTNTAYGKRVAHVFASAGTFDVTCWAFDSSGNVGMATTQITVADPAVFFAGNRTICLNPAGDGAFTGAPAGAQQVTSWSGVVSAMQGLGQPCRILLKRGATYEGVQNWSWATNTRNVYLADYGTGALPRLRPPENLEGSMLSVRGEAGCDSNKFINLDLQGWWDVFSETGSYSSPIYAFLNQNNLLVHGCRIRDWEGFVIGGFETYLLNAVVSNCRIENWRGFGIFVQGGERADSRFAVIGSAIHMHPDALQGIENGYFSGGLGNQNGPFRCGHLCQAFWSCTSLFSNSGWSVQNMYQRDPRQRPSTAQQPPLRAQSDQGGLYSTSVPILWNIERCTFEGGFETLLLSTDQAAHPGNYILDKVVVIANAQTSEAPVVIYTGGTTLRNALVYVPNSPATHDVRPFFVQLGATSHQQGNASRPIRVYGNTFYSPRTSANAQFSGAGFADFTSIDGLKSGQQPFTNVTVENNIIHCPAQNAPVVTSAPLDLVPIPGLVTQYRGPRWNFPKLTQVLAASVPSGGSISFAYPNDSATHPTGRATNQAYFQANPGLNRHQLSGIGGLTPLRTWLGQITVTFGASAITVTNTSGQTWSSGSTVHLVLDRRNDIPPNIASYASPPTVAVPRPIAGSPALGSATLGLVPFDDVFGRTRQAPRTRGALELNV